MKTKPTRILFLFAAFLLLASCSSDDSDNGTNGARIQSILRQDNFNGVWMNTYKTTYTYEHNNMAMSSSLVQNWSGENWTDAKRSFYTLTDSSHASQQIEQKWHYIGETGPWAWVNDVRHTFTYNANGKLIKDEQEFWTYQNIWVLGFKTDYIYDSDSFLIAQESSQWYTTLWGTPFENMVYTNNAAGKAVNTKTYHNGAFDYDETTTYDVNGIFLYSEQLTQNFDGSTYVSLRTDQTTLPNGNIDTITKTFFYNDGRVSMKRRFVYEYD